MDRAGDDDQGQGQGQELPFQGQLKFVRVLVCLLLAAAAAALHAVTAAMNAKAGDIDGRVAAQNPGDDRAATTEVDGRVGAQNPDESTTEDSPGPRVVVVRGRGGVGNRRMQVADRTTFLKLAVQNCRRLKLMEILRRAGELGVKGEEVALEGKFEGERRTARVSLSTADTDSDDEDDGVISPYHEVRSTNEEGENDVNDTLARLFSAGVRIRDGGDKTLVSALQSPVVVVGKKRKSWESSCGRDRRRRRWPQCQEDEEEDDEDFFATDFSSRVRVEGADDDKRRCLERTATAATATTTRVIEFARY